MMVDIAIERTARSTHRPPARGLCVSCGYPTNTTLTMPRFERIDCVLGECFYTIDTVVEIPNFLCC